MSARHLSRLIICLIAVPSLIILPQSVEAVSPLLIKALITSVFASALLLYWSWQLKEDFSATMGRSQLLQYIIVFIIYASCSVIWSHNLDFFLAKWFLWLPAFVALMVASTNKSWLQDATSLYNILRALSLIALLVGFIGVCQFLFGLEQVSQSALPGSLFANRNMAAQIVVLLMPLVFYFFLTTKNSKHRVESAFAITLCLALLFYTRSRAAWISFTFEIMALAMTAMYFHTKNIRLNLSKHQKVLLALIVMAVLVLIMFDQNGLAPFWNVGADQLNSIYSEANGENSPRRTIWSNALQIIFQQPFLGYGLGNYFEVVNHTPIWPDSLTFQRAHNETLEIMVELGFLGLVLLLAILYALGRSIYQIVQSPKLQPRQILLALHTCSALCGIAVSAQFSFPFQWVLPPIITAVYIAIIINLQSIALGEKQESDSINLAAIKPWLIPPVLLIFMASLYLNTNWLQQFMQLEKKDFELKKQTLLHPNIITNLRILGHRYYQSEQYDVNVVIQTSLLDYWPKNYLAWEHLAITLREKGLHEQSLVAIKTLAQFKPQGYFKNHILQMKHYISINQLELGRKEYKMVSNLGSLYLTKNPHYYELMFTYSLFLKDNTRTKYFYDLATEYLAQDNMGMERNMVAFYINNDKLQQAFPHIQKVLQLFENTQQQSAYIEEMRELGINISVKKQ